MLVLSRKQGERIVLNDNVTVEVLAIKNGVVRLGIVAPPSVPVHREELLNRQPYPVPVLVDAPKPAAHSLRPSPRPQRPLSTVPEVARPVPDPRAEADDYHRRLRERLGLTDPSSPINWEEFEQLLFGEDRFRSTAPQEGVTPPPSPAP